MTIHKQLDKQKGKNGYLTRLYTIASGITGTIGVGSYVLIGEIAKYQAGPAVVLSVFIAGIAASISGVCLAEVAARSDNTTPRKHFPLSRCPYYFLSGPGFIQGVLGFLIGWNLIIEYCLGAAIAMKGIFEHVDYAVNRTMSRFMIEKYPSVNPNYFRYSEIFSPICVMLFTVIIAMLSKYRTVKNVYRQYLAMLLVIGTIAGIYFVLLLALSKVNAETPSKWKISPQTIKRNTDVFYGYGGIFPYNTSGVLRGAAAFFYAYISYDMVVAEAQDTKHTKDLVTLIVLSQTFLYATYLLVAFILPLTRDYYKIDEKAPVPDALFKEGFEKFIIPLVTNCVVIALLTSFSGAIFTLSRMINTILSDSFSCCWLGFFSSGFTALIFAGILTAIPVLIFELDHLIYMTSISTLLIYSVVCAYVIPLRYKAVEHKATLFCLPQSIIRICCEIRVLPCQITSYTFVKMCSFPLVPLGILSVVWLNQYENLNQFSIKEHMKWSLLTYISLGSFILFGLLVYSISIQPYSKSYGFPSQSVQCIPWIPCIGILLNSLLIVSLNPIQHYRFVIWSAIGLIPALVRQIHSYVEKYKAKDEQLKSTKNYPVSQSEALSQRGEIKNHLRAKTSAPPQRVKIRYRSQTTSPPPQRAKIRKLLQPTTTAPPQRDETKRSIQTTTSAPPQPDETKRSIQTTTTAPPQRDETKRSIQTTTSAPPQRAKIRKLLHSKATAPPQCDEIKRSVQTNTSAPPQRDEIKRSLKPTTSIPPQRDEIRTPSRLGVWEYFREMFSCESMMPPSDSSL